MFCFFSVADPDFEMRGEGGGGGGLPEKFFGLSGLSLV